MIKELSVRASILVVTFVVGVAVAALWAFHYFPHAPNPSGAVDSAPIVSICDLIKEPADRGAKTVRIQAIVIGFHELALFDPHCKSDDNFVKAEFDSTTRGQLVSGVDGLNGAGFQHGNFWASVTLVGTFEFIDSSKASEVPQLLKFRYRLLVSKVESVQPVAADVPWPGPSQ